MVPKGQTNIRLSDHTKRQLRALAKQLGMSEGQLVMLAIDRLAVAEGLHVYMYDQTDQEEQSRSERSDEEEARNE
jgi:hypothetical protein